MVSFNWSDSVKAAIFFGVAGLWIMWGVVDYFFNYSFQIYSCVLIFSLITWIGIAIWQRKNAVMPAGWVRLINVKIP